ncbi:MAG: hypothetical protein CME62_01300 [Halobacteriovoraceae bacterium]|nr:hypothetical protein [Halobacteriovoraceae bacterium]|tara:strand:- start:8859 stop:10166 length:1308 start_codon:yes stop_codon:yes gene_type:complete
MNTLKCLGSGQEVTGSKYLISGTNTNLLIDCGIYQGQDAFKENSKALSSLGKGSFDGVVLTHAHLDHIGFLPYLVRKGFEGKIFCTPATKDLARILWLDNTKIMSPELAWYYSEQDVKKTLAHMSLHEYEKCFSWNEFKITLYPAGHILGAASPLIEWEDVKIQFSGDLGRDDDILILPPSHAQAKIVVMESTYGDRIHPEALPLKEFSDIFLEAKNSGGTVIIPAFSNARSQNMMRFLEMVFEHFPQAKLPVFVDSPMTMKVTELYERYSKQIKTSASWVKKLKNHFQFVEFASQRKKLASDSQAKIILTASGMLTGGFVMEHLKNHIENESTRILIVGFQSPGTIGAELLKNSLQIEISEQLYSVNAKIHNFTHFSSHRDCLGLKNWLEDQSPAKVFLTHGEPAAQIALKEYLDAHTKHQVEPIILDRTYPLK